VKPEYLIDEQSFKQLTKSIEEELEQGHLYGALGVLDNLLDALTILPGRSALKEKRENIDADYQRLLHFMAEGINDPSRQDLQTRLIQKTFRILQDLRREYEIKTEDNGYSFFAKSTWYVNDENPLTKSLQNQNELDFEAQDQLFNIIWMAPQLHSSEEQELRLFLCSASEKQRCYILSALNISLYHYFDAAKFRILLEYCNSTSEDERARALFGICTVTQLCAKSIALYPALREEVILLMRSEDTVKGITLIQHQICMYWENERMRHRIEDEIIPSLIQAARNRKKMGFDEMDFDLSDEESEFNISDESRKKIENGLLEMNQLFQEGMDMNLHTFTSLKGYSFFSKPAHWLAPFDMARPEVPNIRILQYLPLCDSDKYSLSLLHNHMPEAQRRAMEGMFDNNGEIFAQHSREDYEPFKNVIQNLYRLQHRSPWASLWPDIFSFNMLFIKNGILGKELRKHPDFLKTTANLLLRYRYFEQAAEHLEALAEIEGTDAELLMQLGISMQAQGKYQRAINYYQQADLLDGQNPKILYRLQFCYAMTERNKEQLQCLLELEKADPENPKILTETGLCLMQLERWDEAQKRFFKLEFMEKRLLPSLRAIAWCALRKGDYDQARQYYNRILKEYSTNDNWEDFLNAGHTAWLQGNIQEGATLYVQYYKRYLSANPKATDGLAPFMQDAHILQEKGISESDISLMHDLIPWKSQKDSE